MTWYDWATVWEAWDEEELWTEAELADYFTEVREDA